MSVTVIGDAFIDVIVPAQHVSAGETHHRRILTLPGGTANVAVGVSRLGERASFVGKIGNDHFGGYFRRELARNGVEDLTVVDQEKATGLCVSLVYAHGERAIVADRGANDGLSVNEIEKLRDRIARSRIAYFSGYSFASQLTSDATMYAANACRGKCEIWFNPGAPNTIQDFFKPYISDLVDVLLVNLEEAKVLTGKLGILEAAAGLRELVGLAVITSGEDGCVVVTKGDCIRIPVSQTGETKDTTGAGDAFAAGFAVGRLRGLSLMDCGRSGNAAAASFLKERSEALEWSTCSRYS